MAVGREFTVVAWTNLRPDQIQDYLERFEDAYEGAVVSFIDVDIEDVEYETKDLED